MEQVRTVVGTRAADDIEVSPVEVTVVPRSPGPAVGVMFVATWA
ncbi:MAG: hypothetical protein ACREV3_11060 [Gammaproteobacteria bacterium]